MASELNAKCWGNYRVGDRRGQAPHVTTIPIKPPWGVLRRRENGDLIVPGVAIILQLFIPTFMVHNRSGTAENERD